MACHLILTSGCYSNTTGPKGHPFNELNTVTVIHYYVIMYSDNNTVVWSIPQESTILHSVVWSMAS